jgi:Cdc6-like AAA superfamily ATPase
VDTNHVGGVTATVSDLYKRTFWEIKNERSWSNERISELKVTLQPKDLVKKLLLAITPVFLPLLTEALIQVFSFQQTFIITKWIIYAMLFLWSVLNVFSFTRQYKKSSSDLTLESSIADDDITNNFLEKLLDKFQALDYKLVFVLDELDKVDDEDLDKLLKEMKPWLVRGKADFIVIAGQKLTLRYYQLKEKDDEFFRVFFRR